MKTILVTVLILLTANLYADTKTDKALEAITRKNQAEARYIEHQNAKIVFGNQLEQKSEPAKRVGSNAEAQAVFDMWSERADKNPNIIYEPGKGPHDK